VGFTYLGGKCWSQVTRDERFFCQRLYEKIRSEGPQRFVEFLRGHGLDVPADGEWEVAYEVCFYRDLWQLRRCEGTPLSPKRTFDLCLFGEKAIVIIEAKAAEKFDADQTRIFAGDIAEVGRLTGIENVKLVGICASGYSVEHEIKAQFNGPIISWKKLAARYENDELLLRADAVFEEREAFSGIGRNSEVKLPGTELIEAFQGNAKWWIGRSGGLTGDAFREDVQTGRWRSQRYEVNKMSELRPSANFFRLNEFAAAVGVKASGDNSDI
jgi:hypothetical protein